MSRGNLAKRARDRRAMVPASTFRPVAGRVPPHDLDAEAAVLSAILLERDALDRVLETLKPEHFYSEANRRIYEACVELTLSIEPLDIVSVAAWLRSRERLHQIGGPSYLAQLVDATPAVAHVAAHAKVVVEKWRLRQLGATCNRLWAEIYGDVGDVQEFIDSAEQSIYDLARSNQSESHDVPLSAALKSAFEEADAARQRGRIETGIRTGLTKLDRKLCGLDPGNVYIVAARPGMGKTALMLNIGVNVASPRIVRVNDPDHPYQAHETELPGYGVVIASLEMPKEQLAVRMACSEGRVSLHRWRDHRLQTEEWRRATNAASYLAGLPIWIDDTPAINILQLRARVRRHQAEYNRPAKTVTRPDGSQYVEPERRIGLIIVDYLQLMTAIGDYSNREQEISEISRGLKQLSKELGVPVIALSQLNRSVETRGSKDKRPTLADLRESGAIEQDADAVIFIYRDEYYNPKSDWKAIAELIIAKQRNGPTGKIYTRFDAATNRFDNLEPGQYPVAEDEDE